ncbi:MAG TPA: DHHA1 domain-containing protein [Thermoanaerobaculia bacterium]|nr:DHHA1 domain-containing protein [Thermoanaerobaculia bacterium]
MSFEKTRQRLAELDRVIEASDPDSRWLILTHDNPDPDALASAAILSRILDHRHKRKTTCAYGGIIGRAENREMVRVLGLKFSHLRYLRSENYGHFALVDTQPRTGNNQLPKGTMPDVVFDHHPVRPPTRRVRFADVREHYGATATILGEYLEAAGEKPPKTLATAMIYAIRSETQDFRRESTAPDKALHDRLYPRADKTLLAKIQSSRLPVEYFRNLHTALENLYTVETLVVSHLATLEHPDIVPEVADLLLRMEGKTWSLSTGIHGDRLYMSIRTTNSRADAGRIMRRLVRRDGKGGGHGMLAGGWIGIPPEHAGDPRPLQIEVGRRLASELKKNPERLQRLPIRNGN